MTLELSGSRRPSCSARVGRRPLTLFEPKCLNLNCGVVDNLSELAQSTTPLQPSSAGKYLKNRGKEFIHTKADSGHARAKYSPELSE